ncbi:contact-dependent growth inhibition system immunity protein [Streptomyces sp. NPDC058052]|uniref:contact-dependent growth inhibition system immunity protein n=1 Tax=Streptomyces sp. NPDC058052 TaxID=3346316 RepID=UPI0036EFB8D8
MDRLLHLDRTLDELDPPRWAPPGSDATRLVRTVHGLRRIPLGALGPADLRTLVAQRVALPYVLPLAVRLLLEEPLLDASFYEGDLLLAAVDVPAAAWAPFPDLAARLRTVIAALPEAGVAGLPRDAAEPLARFVARGDGEGDRPRVGRRRPGPAREGSERSERPERPERPERNAPR